jgi:hypothetical protein
MIADIKYQLTNRKWQVGKDLVTCSLIFVIFLGLYTGTLMPDVLPEDSGEFQLVAATAGIAHPPGRPLYTMAGWLFNRLPLGPTPAWRANFFSAVTAAATVVLVFRTAHRLTDSVPAGIAAAVTLGSATTFWATATRASIRPLTAFFTALCVYSLIEYKTQITNRKSQIANHCLVLFAFSLSLGLTHEISLLFPAIVFVAYLLFVDPALVRQPRRWVKPIIGFVLGLLVLVYLPVRDAAGAPLAPGNLSTVRGFLQHFLGLGFGGDMFALSLFDRLTILPTLLQFQFNLPLLLATGFGAAVLLLRRDRRLALLLIGSPLILIVVYLTYRAPQTVEYLMPAYVPMALLVAVPFGSVANLRSRVSEPANQRTDNPRYLIFAIWRLAFAVVLIAGMANLLTHLPSYAALSDSHDAREYAEALLLDAPQNAVILSNWHWTTPMWYMQQVENARPDVTVEYVFPQGRSLARNWVDRIERYLQERPVIVTNFYPQEYGQLPYRFEPFGQGFLVLAQPDFDLPPGLTPIDVTLSDQVALLGYRLETDEAEPSRPAELTLAWSPIVTPTVDISLFAQLIGYDGLLWSATQDALHPAGRLAGGEVVVEQFVIYPLLHALPGDYGLKVGAYSPDGRFTTTEGVDAIQLTTIKVNPATLRPVTARPTFVRFTGGPTLIGVDYDTGMLSSTGMRVYLHWAGPGAEAEVQLLDRSGSAIELVTQKHIPALERGQYATTAIDLFGLPAQIALLDDGHPRRWNLLFGGGVPLPSYEPGDRYVPLGDSMVLAGVDWPETKHGPGEDVTLALRFLSRRPLERDYIVSTALYGINADGTWDWRADDDSVPALGAIPTLKWIRNSTVYDPHRLTIPADIVCPGGDGYLVVYDHFTQVPLPSLDERPPLGHTVPLGDRRVVAP